MSTDCDFPPSRIDRSAFAHALDSGALDDCLYFLRDNEAIDLDVARLNCRLAEVLFHEGRRDDALECGRRAFIIASNDEAVAHGCAWLFSNCGVHAEAAEAYQRLLDRHPDWVEGYRHLSGSLAANGNIDAAITFALKASALAPGNFDFALHAGCLLLDAQRFDEATLFLERATDIEPRNPQALRALSAAECAVYGPQEAIELALRAAALAPNDSDLVAHASELLLRADRVGDALALLRKAAGREPANPTLWRLISASWRLGKGGSVETLVTSDGLMSYMTIF